MARIPLESKKPTGMLPNALLVISLVSSSIFGSVYTSSGATFTSASAPPGLDSALSRSHNLVKNLTKTLREIQAGAHSAEDEARLRNEIVEATEQFKQASTDISAAAASAPAPTPASVSITQESMQANQTSGQSSQVASAARAIPASTFKAPASSNQIFGPSSKVSPVFRSAPRHAALLGPSPFRIRDPATTIDLTTKDKYSYHLSASLNAKSTKETPNNAEDGEDSDFEVPGTKRSNPSSEVSVAKLPRNEFVSGNTSTTFVAPKSSSEKIGSSSGSIMNIGVPLDTIRQRLNQRKNSPAVSNSSTLVQSPALSGAVLGSLPTSISATLAAQSSVESVSNSDMLAANALSQLANAPSNNLHQGVVDQFVHLIPSSDEFVDKFIEFIGQNPENGIAILSQPSRNGQSLFEIAVRSNNTMVASLLIGAKAFSTSFANGENALLIAVKQKNVELVRAMMDVDAFKNQVNFVILGAAAVADPRIVDIIKPFISK